LAYQLNRVAVDPVFNQKLTRIRLIFVRFWGYFSIVDVVQKSGKLYDLKICALRSRNPSRHIENAQRVKVIMPAKLIFKPFLNVALRSLNQSGTHSSTLSISNFNFYLLYHTARKK
jgi:hypothetical protein